MKTTLEFILAGTQVKRYHTVTTLALETVGHHSAEVALIVLLLEPDARRQLLTAALFHDLAEHQTGDIPSPAKRVYGIGEQVDDLEKRLMHEAGIFYPALTEAEARTVKLADIAQGALFCAREINTGNRKMRTVFDRYLGYAEQMILIGRERELFNLIKEQVQ